MARAKLTTKKRSSSNAKDAKRTKKATSKRKASPKTTRAAAAAAPTAAGATRSVAAKNRKTTAKRKAAPKKKRAGATKATLQRKASPKRAAATTKVLARAKAGSRRTKKATPPAKMPMRKRETIGRQTRAPERDSANRTESHDTLELRTPNHEGERNEVNADALAFLRHSGTERDDFAEERGEATVETMTSGEYIGEDQRDQIVPEEHGGPFVETGGRKEFASGTDPSNPNTATREPFPRS